MIHFKRAIVRMILLIMGFILWASGCSGIKITATPDPSTLQTSFLTKCGTVAIQKNKTGLVVREFVNELRDSMLFDKVYYPPKTDVPTDLVLKPIFSVEYDKNVGSGIAKEFVSKACLGLPLTVVRFHSDYHFAGQIEVYEGSSKIDTVSAKAKSQISAKYHSREEIESSRPEAFRKGKEALYKQLIIKIEKYCENQR